MELINKLEVLADSAKYDVSCSSSGSSRQNSPGGIGNSAPSGICHSWSDDGRCISLLKTLFTNSCIYDCAYCINRASNDRPRASFTPRQVAELTVNFYKRNYIEGLFLSSGIKKDPDYTMEQIVETLRLLREEYKFNGYIHAKAIPGSDLRLIFEAGQLADRISVNIELPSRESLENLAPQKSALDILNPMKNIGSRIGEVRENQRKYRNAGKFVPAGQSTQLIVGASPESDYRIMKLADSLYSSYNMKRVYYSAFMPVKPDSRLPALKMPPLLREHRLYQADWLLRFYDFEVQELFSGAQANLDYRLDPKLNWALNNLDRFPVEINQADYHDLLRVPGIGPRSARKIVETRREARISYQNLKKLGPVLKRARYFITCQGKYRAGIPFREDLIKVRIREQERNDYHQASLFAEEQEKEEGRNDQTGKLAVSNHQTAWKSSEQREKILQNEEKVKPLQKAQEMKKEKEASDA